MEEREELEEWGELEGPDVLRELASGRMSETLVEALSLLTELSLRDTDIDDADAAVLAEALKRNATLTELDLCHNDIGEAGAAALSEALKSNTTLRTLEYVIRARVCRLTSP